MRLQFLKHLIDSVQTLAKPRRIVVIGSSSLLPRHADLGDAGAPLEVSLAAGRNLTAILKETGLDS